MAYQFFSKGKYQLNHVDLKLSNDSQHILFIFDWVEKTILCLVYVTNTLWLPIFLYQLWELDNLIKVLEEYDKYGILKANEESQYIIKVSLEE